ncbi:flavin reductase family protein [Catellatospora sp. KI3]|uniref:flavin reductase family protein n=1 Tax=Catellatospora sp. KI3 TaxID=3041620 RepID=UPI0024829202|nr:flavin reductase family protein [Catellatospora sp. KI3]MDI1461480.1 flavin reductase family protein [Catellatospora sp. KI3]
MLVADPKALRRAFGAYATGVTVVTVGGDTPHGMTANSFTTVSLDPPLVLICVGHEAIMHGVLAATNRFAVSVLGSGQEAVARYFADRNRPMGKEQFDAVDWTPGRFSGAPLIIGALAHFECEVRARYDGGDHTIFLSELLSVERAEDDDALLFLHGRFHQIHHERSDVTR